MNKHNIELFGDNLSEDKITIKGNKLNLRWFDKCLLIWSDKDNKEPLPKKFLEIIEKSIEENSKLGGEMK